MSENQQNPENDSPLNQPRTPQEFPLPDYYAEPAQNESAPLSSSPVEAAPDPRLPEAIALIENSDQPVYEPQMDNSLLEPDEADLLATRSTEAPVLTESTLPAAADSVDIPVLAPASPEPARAPLEAAAPFAAAPAAVPVVVPPAAATQVLPAAQVETAQPKPVSAAVAPLTPASADPALPSRRQARLAQQVAATGPSLWEHLVGIVLGVVLAALGLLTVGLGASRISELNSNGIQVDNLGIVFVCLGAVIVAAIISLGLWTAAVPFTAGIITTAAGGLLLFAPQIGANVINDLLRNNSNAVTVDWLIADGNAGWYFILGILLLVSGIVNSTLKRRVRRVAKMLLAD